MSKTHCRFCSLSFEGIYLNCPKCGKWLAPKDVTVGHDVDPDPNEQYVVARERDGASNPSPTDDLELDVMLMEVAALVGENSLIYRNLRRNITAREAGKVEAVQIKSFDDGYEAGRNETPPSLVGAEDFRREQYGWSDSKMAAMLDLSKSHYSEFKHGRRSLPINSIRKAYAIGIPAKVLLQEDVKAQLQHQTKESK